LGWANGLGVLVSDRSSAAQFFLDTEGYLRVGSSYVDTDSSQPYLIFHLITAKSGNLSKWTIDGNGILSLQSQSVSTCVDQSGTVFIVFGSSGPSGCSATILDISPVASGRSSWPIGFEILTSLQNPPRPRQFPVPRPPQASCPHFPAIRRTAIGAIGTAMRPLGWIGSSHLQLLQVARPLLCQSTPSLRAPVLI
jgi:hypothetical protein